MSVVSAREFNRDASAAKRAAEREPVFITDRGAPSHVLLSIEEFRRLAGEARNLADQLAMTDDVEFESEPVQLRLGVPEL